MPSTVSVRTRLYGHAWKLDASTEKPLKEVTLAVANACFCMYMKASQSCKRTRQHLQLRHAQRAADALGALQLGALQPGALRGAHTCFPGGQSCASKSTKDCRVCVRYDQAVAPSTSAAKAHSNSAARSGGDIALTVRWQSSARRFASTPSTRAPIRALPQSLRHQWGARRVKCTGNLTACQVARRRDFASSCESVAQQERARTFSGA